MQVDSTACSSCESLRSTIATLRQRIRALVVHRSTDRKKLGLGDLPRICREIKRTNPGRPHQCNYSLDKSIRRELKAEPCRPLTEIGAGAIVLERCEYLRLMRLIQKTDECWMWQGALNPGGYGVFGWSDQRWQAHRFVYTLFVGKIEYGLVLDHRCLTKSCVNPDHLEQVTQAENVRRAMKRAE